MATLQVKNLPDELHSKLSERAREMNITMSEFVTRTLRRELSRPSLDSWIREMSARPVSTREIDVVGALDAARNEYDRLTE